MSSRAASWGPGTLHTDVKRTPKLPWPSLSSSAGRVGRSLWCVSPKVLESYVGEYQFETLNNRIFIVTREGDKLFVQEPGRPRFQVFAESETKFFLKDRTWRLVFTKSEGQAAQLKIVQGDRPFPRRGSNKNLLRRHWWETLRAKKIK